MDTSNAVMAVAVFGGFLFLAGLAKGNMPTKEDQVALEPTSSTYLGSRYYDDRPEASLSVWSPSGDRWDCSLYPDGLLYEPKGQGTATGKPGDPPGEAEGSKPWRYELKVHRYPFDWSTDLGAWGGFHTDPESESGKLDIGFRYSPIRIAYGVIAPDILVSPNQAGLGGSLYMPAQTTHGIWRHMGVGLGYTVEFDGGQSGWVPYVALSTRF